MAGLQQKKLSRRHFTPEEKADLIRQARQLVLASGLPIAKVAQKLGLHDTTLSKWLRLDQTGDFRPVVLASVTTEEVPVPLEAHSPTPVLVTPAGYRVEGLDVTGVAELLRRLR